MLHIIWSISTANLKKYGWNFYRFFVLLFERMEKGSSKEGTTPTKIRDYRVDNNSNRKRKIDEITSTV